MPRDINPLGNLPSKASRMWEHVYESAQERGLDKGASAAQAWCAVKRRYYKKNDRWLRRKAPLGPDQQPPRCTPSALVNPGNQGRFYIGSDDCDIGKFIIRKSRTVSTEAYDVPIFVTDTIDFARLHAGYQGCIYHVQVNLGKTFDGLSLFDSESARYWPPEPESFTVIGRDVERRIESGEIFPGQVDDEADVYALFASLANNNWDAIEHPTFLRWLYANGYGSARVRGESSGNHFAVLDEQRVVIVGKSPAYEGSSSSANPRKSKDVLAAKRRLLR